MHFGGNNGDGYRVRSYIYCTEWRTLPNSAQKGGGITYSVCSACSMYLLLKAPARGSYYQYIDGLVFFPHIIAVSGSGPTKEK